jgi:4-diphosphocytidyl-2-C-methyl-D-erythritol kinase
MLLFPNCKINLGLDILRKRDDGFHNIETVFYPIPFTDVLEVVTNTQTDSVEFTGTGLVVDGNAEDNLCIKAYRLLKRDFLKLPAVKIHLHKVIPMGAGLGGGSADAAFMLILLNDKFRLSISVEKLIDYALQLGSDCPFFLQNKPGFATGRGELIEELSLDLSSYKIVLINPGIHINTGWAFSQITPAQPKRSIKEIVQEPIETWKTDLKNDFEEVVFAAHPEIKEIKEELYRQGAIYASMSGSGSTVFGIFSNSIETASFSKKDYFIKLIN